MMPSVKHAEQRAEHAATAAAEHRAADDAGGDRVELIGCAEAGLGDAEARNEDRAGKRGEHSRQAVRDGDGPRAR